MTPKPEMTGPQHYRAAEKVLADATLALAAATAASGSTPAAASDQEWNHIAWEI